MAGKFQYSVLKYRHSYAIGEVVNLGIIFLYDDGEFEFRFPSKLGRLSQMYSSGINLGFIKSSLSSFKNRVNIFNKSKDELVGIEEDLAVVLQKYLLPENSSSLYFEEVVRGIYKEKVTISNYFYNLYLNWYEYKSEERKDERYVIDRVKTILRKRYDADFERRFRIEKVLTDSKNLVSHKFDYGWQNGKLNLITPISFDLTSDQSYDAKALRWRSLFAMLKTEAETQKIEFDVLLARPTERNLFSQYDRAIEVIKDANAPVKIIEESEYEEYLDHAVDVVLDDNH